MPSTLMQLKVLLPSVSLIAKDDVLSIVADTPSGAFGILPQRLDCAAALIPGILVYQTQGGAEGFIAVDEGLLVKVGNAVTVTVRRAVQGTDLATLHRLVAEQFLSLNQHEIAERTLKAKLETGFLKRFASFQDE
jgi:F-type H+-transporting ATPase subunit epsilon